MKRPPLMHPGLAIGTALAAAAGAAAQPLPPVPVPPENPITEAKRVLGKILFWDAQLSSDNTVACGTCHVNVNGGTDPRLGLHPGPDGVPFTDDDKIGSPGVIRTLADDRYAPDPVFGLQPQVTRRAANPAIMAQHFPELFWDGRAPGAFVDPETGETAIAAGGALESQVVAPPVSDVEMAHEARDWGQISAKLQTARPLAVATGLPPDVAAAIASRPTYPQLFADAFGDGAISARRIAFAIATYERTLVADQTPFDLGMLTPSQQVGLDVFEGELASCSVCHVPPLFSDHTFRNIGVRPIAEDEGRFEVTGDPDDLGRFKVPGLRNVGLKPTFMHHGGLASVEEVIDFYAGDGPPQSRENIDPLIPPIFISPLNRGQLADFLRNGLTDPRVVAETFPFDRPRLHTELLANPEVLGAGWPGSGGFEPAMIAITPPNLGHQGFKVGVRQGLGGATAVVALSRSGPEPDGTLQPFELVGPMLLDGAGPGGGHATWIWPIPDDERLLGADAYVQWLIDDPGALGGVARSPAARVRFYRDDPTQCGCPGDVDCDGVVAVGDLIGLILQWGECDLCGADLDDDGDVDVEDLVGLVTAWGACGG